MFKVGSQFVRSHPRLVAVLVFFVLMNILFVAVHAGWVSVPGFEFVGSDARVVINAGMVARQQGEVFPLLPWEEINPQLPLSNARYDISMHLLFSVFGPVPQPIYMVLIHFWIVGGWVAYILLSQRIVRLLAPGLKNNLVNFLWVFFGASSLMLNLAYLNIEVWVVVATLYVIYTMLKDDLSFGGILAVAFILATKPQFVVPIIVLAWVLQRWVFALYYTVTGAGGLILMVLFTSLLFDIDVNYAIGQMMSRFEFLVATPDLFPWHLYQELAPNSLALVALKLFGQTGAGVSFWVLMVVVAYMLVVGTVLSRQMAASTFTTSERKLNALALALSGWSFAQLLLWQVEYNSFAPLVFMLVMLFGSASMKKLVLLLLPYILFQFVDLILLGLGSNFSLVQDLPLVIFSLFVQMTVLALPLRIPVEET